MLGFWVGRGLSRDIQHAEGSGFSPCGPEAIRFSTPDSLDAFLRAEALQKTSVSHDEALEESFFLGLRLNRGVNLDLIRQSFGVEIIAACDSTIHELVDEQLLDQTGNTLRLTTRGRLLSNEVFERFIASPAR
jgi:oxygen-independent coproporphyrinogen-3 oxidase